MKREIKFRAWSINKKRFINLNGVDILFQGCSNEGAVYEIYEQGKNKTYPIDEVELIQFTGLKDKNGKEIYEGDIIACDYLSDIELSYGVIEWFRSGWYNKSLDDPTKRVTGYSELSSCKNIEVIGNIYENPDLL